MKAFTGLVFISAAIALLIGWVMNVIALFGLTLESPLGWIIGRVIGVFIPFVGGVLGYF
jgi:hypothetical protein